MRSIKSIQAAKAGYVALSALLCALGAVLLLWPGFSLRLLCRVTGGALVAFGAVKLAGYFSRDLYRLAFQFDLAFGLLLIALGAVLLLRPVGAMSMLCLALGVVVAADGLFKLQTALDARRFGLSTWWLILALGLVAGAAGVAMAAHPSDSARALTALTGAALEAEGLLNLCVGLCAVKIVRHQRPDVIETQFTAGRERS